MKKSEFKQIIDQDIKRLQSEPFTLDQIVFREKLKRIIETPPGDGRVKMSPKIVPPSKNQT